VNKDTLMTLIINEPEVIEFDDVIQVISQYYDYTPTRFTNGKGDTMVINEAGTNEGSCKIFAFARLNGLNAKQTLASFGRFYREDVLLHPDKTDHGNIRNFMLYGWDGIQFSGNVLTAKK
jgi:hypothetical protein